MYDEIKQFDAELTNTVMAQVFKKFDDFLWWTVYDILERPIQDIGLVRMINEMKEKYKILFV